VAAAAASAATVAQPGSVDGLAPAPAAGLALALR